MADQTFDNLVVNNTLGIGTTEPAAQLHIAATEGISSKVFLESINGGLLKVTAESNSVSLGTENAFPLSINTNGLPRIQISSDGNIGMGTPPVTDAKLTVNGTVKATAFQGDGSRLSGKVNTSGDTMTGSLTVQANLSVSGNVSIGTTSSSYKLAIAAGDINIDDGRALRQAGRWVIGGDSNVLGIGSSNAPDGRDIRFDPGFAGALTIKKDTGNVGIGTTSPGTKLEVKGHLTLDAGESPTLYTGTGGSELNRYLQLINSSNSRSASGLKAGGILVSDSYAYANPSKNDLIVKGNVGIGTANPTNKLHVVGGGPVTIENAGEADILFKDTSSGQQWQVGTNSTGWYVYNNAYFLVVKKDSGNVGIGTTSPAYKLDVAGEVHASNFPTSSDVRLKTSITPLTNVLEKLEKIRGVAFEWNELYASLGRSTKRREIGVTAQEVEAVFPELVTTWGEEGYKAVDYGRLTSVLIEAAKELNTQNSALKQRIEVLEKAMAGSQAKT